VLARTVRLLAQLTNQVAVVQYPSLARTQVRHIELVAVGEDRVLCVLILGTGVVEQQVASLPAARVTEAWVHGLRDRLAVDVVGAGLEDAVSRVQHLKDTLDEWAAAGETALVGRVLDVVLSQLQANRSERITIAGTANLSRPMDFASSLPAVLEAIEEQVTILRLFGELTRDGREVSASIGRENEPYGISGTSVIASSYESGGSAPSGLGVLGPTRMDYASNIAAVRAVARYLSGVLGEE
jgi:heat-inducible transcriptional repressor